MGTQHSESQVPSLQLSEWIQEAVARVIQPPMERLRDVGQHAVSQLQAIGGEVGVAIFRRVKISRRFCGTCRDSNWRRCPIPSAWAIGRFGGRVSFIPVERADCA
jgi:hypothetical protein